MRQVSKKQRAIIDAARPFREEFLRRFPICWVCGKASECVHEITNGAARTKTLKVESCLIACCWNCNSGPLNAKGEMPVATQLSLVARFNPTAFDREEVNIARGRAPHAITEADVITAAVEFVTRQR